MAIIRAHTAHLLLVLAFCAVPPLGAAPQSAHASGTIWTVTSASDDASDGSAAAHSGSLRFVLARAHSGDTVHFGELHTETLAVGSTLSVPAGVAVGHSRAEPCSGYGTPLITIADPALTPTSAIQTIFDLGAGATLRDVAILGGRTAVRISGADAELCGVGIGRTVGGDGDVITRPPWTSALMIDGAAAVVRRSYLNGAVSVTANGGGSRIGDVLGGSGDSNGGIRVATVTISATGGAAARNVTVRDPFPRALVGLAGVGVAGGDDVAAHANHWAQTPAVTQASSADGFASVDVIGTASPQSLVDIYLDTQVDVVRLGSATADSGGAVSYHGPLPGAGGQIFIASTLNDPAQPQRIGSSSQLSGAASIAPASSEALLAATGAIANVSAPGSSTASAGDLIRFTVSITNVGGADVMAIAGSGLSVPSAASVIAGSGHVAGGTGFAAGDTGFSGGLLQMGQCARYTLDMRIAPQATSGSIIVRMEVAGSQIVTIPVVGRMPIAPRTTVPRVFLPITVM